jgi:peptidyl-prolyl cis-trans isomerase SDCCAG10
MQVKGNTIYNMDALGDLEVDADDRPLYPPRIIGSEVINNPFNDIVPREVKRSAAEEVVKVKVRGKLNTNLLSFQDDVEDEEADAADASKFKIRSAHDVADSNGRLAREIVNVKALPQVQRRAGKIVDESSDEDEDESSRSKHQEVDLGTSALHGENGKEERQAALMRLKEEIRELKKKSLVGADSQPAVGKVIDRVSCSSFRSSIVPCVEISFLLSFAIIM